MRTMRSSAGAFDSRAEAGNVAEQWWLLLARAWLGCRKDGTNTVAVCQWRLGVWCTYTEPFEDLERHGCVLSCLSTRQRLVLQ